MHGWPGRSWRRAGGAALLAIEAYDRLLEDWKQARLIRNEKALQRCLAGGVACIDKFKAGAGGRSKTGEKKSAKQKERGNPRSTWNVGSSPPPIHPNDILWHNGFKLGQEANPREVLATGFEAT
jgi:hypothetical protein